jgi:ribosome maturation factor RimP
LRGAESTLAKKKITEYIAEWMMDFGRENGYELSRSEFIKEGEAWYLRIFVDKLTQSGYTSMSTEDCEFVSKYTSAQLDRFDPITQAYYLEVSSPGLDRPLITDKDFERFKGQMIDIKLYHPLNGQKALQGKLLGLCDGAISVLDEQGNEITVQKEQVGKVSLAVIF